jgi:hypothetical protein
VKTFSCFLLPRLYEMSILIISMEK